jgi:hypothetical protein
MIGNCCSRTPVKLIFVGFDIRSAFSPLDAHTYLAVQPLTLSWNSGEDAAALFPASSGIDFVRIVTTASLSGKLLTAK